MKHLTHILAIVVATALSVGAALYITHSTTTIAPVEALSEAPVITTDTIRLLFGGDFMQHMPQVNAARTPDGSYDYSRSTEYIAPMFREADVAVINLETTISTTGHYSGYPCFASPVEVVDEFETMGIDIALLANNHCCDRMARGIETTIEELNRRNIAHTGV